jgi:hypothetical protein
MVKAITIRKKL